MKHRRLLVLPALLALAFSFGAAQAQGTPGTGSSVTGGQSAPAAQPGTGTRNTPQAKLARGDRKFVEHAAQGGMFEVQAGQLAVSRASNPQVKAYAQRLVDDHSKGNNELTQIANAKGVELPAAPKRSDRREIEKLAKKTGGDFDKEFVKNAVKDHKKDIKEFEKAAKDVKDPDLKAFAEKTLPVLRDHLAQAEALEKSRNDAAAMGAGK